MIISLRSGVSIVIGAVVLSTLLLLQPALAAVSFGSASSAANNSGSSSPNPLTITKPSSTSSGDFLIAGISYNGGTGTVLTAPSGWNLIRRTDNGSGVGLATYYKVAGGSEPASYQWNITNGFGSSPRAAGGIMRYIGVNATPVDVSAGATGFTSSNKFVTAPSVNTTVANDLVINFFGIDDRTDNSGFTPQSPLVSSNERFDNKNSDNNGPSISAVDFAKASAGSTGATNSKAEGTGTFTEWVAQTVAIKMQPTNTAPVANSASVSTNEDTPVGITLSATDAENSPLTYTVGTPAHGSLTGTAPSLTYSPDANYYGPDSFTFTVNDGSADSNTATISVTVNSNNDLPTAGDVLVSTHVNNPTTITLDGHDLETAIGALIYTILTTPENGTLSSVSGNEITYTPNDGFTGQDLFTYSVDDGTAESAAATVYVIVDNHAPTLAPILDQTVTEGTELQVSTSATDSDEDTLVFSLVGTVPSGASINSATGAFSWTPSSDQGPGVYAITVQVSDGNLSDSKTFEVTVIDVPVTDPQCTDTQTLVDHACVDNPPVDPVDPTCTETQTLVNHVCVENTPPAQENTGGSGGNNDSTFKDAGGAGRTDLSGSTGGSGSIGGGIVLGTSTEAVVCSNPLLTTYLRFGRKNDSEQVKKLQEFLNMHLNAKLDVSGTFDLATQDAVKAFQLKHADDVLKPWKPWGLKDGVATGYVYKTTQRMINLLSCSTLNIPVPQLP